MKEIIGSRLRQERERLGLSQSAVCKALGTATRTQIAWEKGEQVPNALHLSQLAAEGFDILFIVSAQRTTSFETELEALSDSWKAIDAALYETGKTLPPEKKKIAAEALYTAVKNGEGTLQSLSKLMTKAA